MTRRPDCSTCTRLRGFFSVALPLIALIYLQPETALRIAGRLPDATVIGWGIALGVPLAFGLRYAAWRRAGRR
ncbi:hypothetical protein [Roseicyclus sp.]|jgi:hypothetical protein